MQDDSITSQITRVYDPAGVETKWYQYWLDHKLFEAHVDHSKKHDHHAPAQRDGRAAHGTHAQ